MSARKKSIGVLCSLVLVFGPARLEANPPEIDSVMFADPILEVPAVVRTLPAGQSELWGLALRHTEAELQHRVATEIRRAHHLGVLNLDQHADSLISLLKNPELNPQTRLACAQTLVALNIRQAAAVLFPYCVHGDLSFSQLVEPALADWNFQPIRDVWLKRLTDRSGTSAALLLVAIQGVQTARDQGAVDALQKLALASSTRPDIRFAAAEALALMPSRGSENEIRLLVTDKTPYHRMDRLVAALMLSAEGRETDPDVLTELSDDPEPAVAAVAWQRLLQIDPGLIVERAEQRIEDADGKIRLLAAKALSACPTEGRIALLARLLDDPLPDLRSYARTSLTQLASHSEFHENVTTVGMEILSGTQRRAVEQAILLLSTLNHEPGAVCMLDHLKSSHPECSVAAAWGLRHLAVPETFPRLLECADQTSNRLMTWPPNTPGERHVDAALSQMFQAFGQTRYRPAAELLLKFVPKIQPGIDSQSRLAAIWALGHIHAAESPPELVSQLLERLADEGDLPPETSDVKRMSAVSLGRMHAQPALATLRQYYESQTPDTVLGRANGWAIEQLTGEKMPDPVARHIELGNWSLIPLD